MFNILLMSGFLRQLFQFAHRLCPRMNHAVLWGWPDHEDHVIALEQALQGTRLRRVVILMTDPASPAPWQAGPKTLRVRKLTAAGLWWFLTARYVFFTHPCFTRNFPPGVVAVNVWHGMPIKKIGWLLPGDSGIACAFTPVTSPFWGGIMERAMRPGGALPNCGLPRNDHLFCDRAATRRKLGLAGGRRLLAWLPTYRKSVRGLPRSDGHGSVNVFEMPDVDPGQLNAFLAERDAMLLVKPHPMAAAGKTENRSHLVIIDDGWLHARGLSLYEMLGASDCLISDISSVVIDYLLLDRPVVHAFADLAEYQESRGFTVARIDGFFAGPVVTKMDELTATLDSVLAGMDPAASSRSRLLEISHSHRDGNATRRLLDAAGL